MSEEFLGVASSHPKIDVLTHRSGGSAGFYGTTPITIRSAAAQGTSLVGTASSTAVDTDVKAALIEVMDTLAALGLWTGSA